MNDSSDTEFKYTTQAFRYSLLAWAVVVALSPTALHAQETKTPTKDDDGFETIYVTASKRLQGVQETPIAVTVISGEAIEQANVLDIGDLQTLVPTLRVTPLQRSINTNFAIRGFGNGTNNTGIEPSVGIFIDGVYRSRAAALIGDLPRLQQIEVLNGPQSTLFGKNASAGVISVRTEAPSDDFEGKIEAGIGNYNQRLIKGYVNNGITDNLAFSLSAGMNIRDGFSKSIVGLGDINDRDRWNVRGQMLYQPDQDVTVRFIVDHSEIDELCCTTSRPINGPRDSVARALGGVVLDQSTPFSYDAALNIDPRNLVDDSGVSLQVDVDYDGFFLTAISAFRRNNSSYTGDVDFTSLDILTTSGHTEIDTFTQEIRLTSTGQNTLDWMVGGFYFNEELDTGDTLFFGRQMRTYFDALLSARGAAGLLGGVEGIYDIAPGSFFSAESIVNSEFTQKDQAYSFFVNLDYHITDAFTATAALNYTKDNKDITAHQRNTDVLSGVDLDNDLTTAGVPIALIPTLSPAIPILKSFQFLPQSLDFPNSVEDGTSNDSKTTWSVRLAYKLNKNINFFAKAATGFKATSWNLSRDTLPFLADQKALSDAGLLEVNQGYGTRLAAPEKTTVVEFGIKSRFKKGAVNITFFSQEVEDFQSSTFVGTGFVLTNAGEQTTKGFELDSVFNATDNLSLTLVATFLDPIYDSFVGASGLDGPVDLSGEKPAGIHERSIAAGITYSVEFDNGMYGYIRTDYLYESEVQIAANVPEFLTREVSTLNLSAGLNLENGVDLKFWIRNINNDEYFMSAFPPPIQAGTFSAYPNQPRTLGANISYTF